MPDGVIRFRWHRPRQGVEVREVARVPVLWVKRSRAMLPWQPGFADEWESYEPLADAPRLFDDFARLEPDPAAYAAFASRWGLLGIGAVPSIRQTSRRGAFNLDAPERASDWARAVAELREALELLHLSAAATGEARGTGRVEALRELEARIKVKDGSAHLRRPYGQMLDALQAPGVDPALLFDDPDEKLPKWEWIALVAPSGFPEPWRACKTDLPAAARLLVASWISYRLEGHVGWGVWPAMPSGKVLPFSVGAEPDSLLAALWMQLAQVVAQGRAPRRCDACGQVFVIDPRSRRGHGDWCSPACRKWMGHLRKRALELSEKGLGERAIAKDLDGLGKRKRRVTAGEVRRWVEA